MADRFPGKDGNTLKPEAKKKQRKEIVCPECGGKTGYSYLMAVEYTQFCDWNGFPVYVKDNYRGYHNPPKEFPG